MKTPVNAFATIALACAILTITGCSQWQRPSTISHVSDRGFCGPKSDDRAWVRTAPNSEEVTRYRSAVEGHPMFPIPPLQTKESWFRAGNSIILCRTDTPLPRNACATEWWELDLRDAEHPKYVTGDASICVT
jgi:hypothetical protein